MDQLQSVLLQSPEATRLSQIHHTIYNINFHQQSNSAPIAYEVINCIADQQSEESAICNVTSAERVSDHKTNQKI